jgi:hypothetical protein
MVIAMPAAVTEPSPMNRPEEEGAPRGDDNPVAERGDRDDAMGAD